MAKQNSADRATKMLTTPMPSLIASMALPSIIAFLINSIYSLADTYFVSSLGTNATAAVSVNGSLDQIIMMAGSMLAVGAASYISRLLGGGDKEKANHVLSTAYFLALAFGALVMVLGISFMKPMVRMLGATDTCEQYAIQYATYVLLVAPFMATNFVLNQCLRAEGNSMLSMVGMASGGIINCILDPIFIFKLDMGVAGASIATAISKLISFSILMYPYLTHKCVLRMSVKKILINSDIMGQIVAIGSSSMFRSGLAVVAAIVLNQIAGRISDSVLAGIGVSTRVMMFPMGIIIGLGTGFQPVAGFSWGAKRYDRVREAFRFSSMVGIVGGAIMGLLLAVFANGAIGLFAKADPEMQRIGALCIRIQCLALPVHGWVAIVNMLCAGLGDAKGALLLSTCRQGTCFIPLVPILAWALGATGVASVQGVADIVSLALAIPVYRSISKKISKAEAALQEAH